MSLLKLDRGGKYGTEMQITFLYRTVLGAWGSLIDIATDWTTEVQFPARTIDFSISYDVQTGSGAHRAFSPLWAGSPFPGEKAARAWN
jgi:hypothetical protein